MGSVAKAIAAGLGAAASYFIGVLAAIGATAGFADLTTVQWLGAIPALLVVYGVVWLVPNSNQ